MLEHTHLYIDQYLIVVTFHRDVLQVGYSPLSLLYALGDINFLLSQINHVTPQ